MWQRWCAVVALGALGACGSTGSGDEVTPEDLGEAYNDDRQDLLDTANRLDALSGTGAANLPTSGSASYEGQAGIAFESPVGIDVTLVGDATVTANFGQGTVSGQAGDFIGIEGGLNPQDYDGTLNLSGGQIGAELPGGVSGRLSGSLTSEDHDVTIDTPVRGEFVGNPDAEGVRLVGAGSIGTVDGRPTPGLAVIVADR